ncbi:hypothetical protein EVAR_57042_1 [Eumeta japonica]|uniref:Uncharacterized protein n=1 Tax=Eumeta variegata TaxID=151549 RepID=A0A4C1YTB8_EUMVA|nr:hypothetical protein EVAR_57042_1 [Eumeta japonica]
MRRNSVEFLAINDPLDNKTSPLTLANIAMGARWCQARSFKVPYGMIPDFQLRNTDLQEVVKVFPSLKSKGITLYLSAKFLAPYCISNTLYSLAEYNSGASESSSLWLQWPQQTA